MSEAAGRSRLKCMASNMHLVVQSPHPEIRSRGTSASLLVTWRKAVNMSTIVFHDVSKRFRDKQIFLHENFQLKEGLTFLVGKNGAGKTTFINLSVGLEFANEGSVELFGHSLSKIDKNMKKKIGIQMQNDAFLRNVRVKEYIKLYEALYDANRIGNGEKLVDTDRGTWHTCDRQSNGSLRIHSVRW